jgi:phage gp45-like
MKHLQNQITNSTKRGIVTLPGQDNGSISNCQVKHINGKVSPAENVYPYGFAAKAPAGTMTLLFAVGGNEANLAGIQYSQQERFKGLKDGEVVVGSPSSGSYVKFLANGDIQIESKGKLIINVADEFNIKANKINIETQDFKLTSPAMTFASGSFSFGFGSSGVFQGNGKFNFGEGGAAVARVGDQVTVGGTTGTITSGSTNNTSN